MACDQRVTLLTLGTLKLVLIDLLGLGFCVADVVVYGSRIPLYLLIILCVNTLIYISNVVYSITLLCGSYKRHKKLLRVFFWYSIVAFIVSVLQISHSFYSYYMMASSYGSWEILMHTYQFYITVLLFGCLNFALQLSIMVFVRRELVKLETAGGDTELRHV